MFVRVERQAGKVLILDAGEPTPTGEVPLRELQIEEGSPEYAAMAAEIEEAEARLSAEEAARGPRPSEYHRFSLDRLSWVEDLTEFRNEVKGEIDEAAERVRTKYLTPGSGQALEYEAAVREAQALQAGLEGPFPMLQADVDAGLVPTLSDAAQLVLGKRNQWEPIGAEIRRVRLKAKREVDEAESQKEIASIRELAIAELEHP